MCTYSQYTCLFFGKEATFIPKPRMPELPKGPAFEQALRACRTPSPSGTLRLRQAEWGTTNPLFTWKATVHVVRLLRKGVSLANPCDFLHKKAPQRVSRQHISHASREWAYSGNCKGLRTHTLSPCGLGCFPSSVQPTWPHGTHGV